MKKYIILFFILLIALPTFANGWSDNNYSNEDKEKVDSITAGAEPNPALPTQEQAEDLTSETEYSWNPLSIGYFVAEWISDNAGSLWNVDDAASDGTGYVRKDGAWVAESGGGGSGDVTGPSGAVAGNLPLLDATGKILSDSGSKVDGTAYDATSWNDNPDVADKDALRDKFFAQDASLGGKQEQATALDLLANLPTTPSNDALIFWDFSETAMQFLITTFFLKKNDFTADGEILVGTGNDAYQAESGETLRASIGCDPIGTDNSTDVTLNASATTGGLSISTQEISNQAATNAQNGYMTAALVGNIETNNAKVTYPGYVFGTGSGDMLEGDTAIPSVTDGTTAGQMAFWDGSTWAPTETTELFWDDTNKRVGIGTAIPLYTTHIAGPLRIQDASYSGMLVLGADAGACTMSTNSNKQARVAGVTYGSSYTMGLFSYISESSKDKFIIGSEAGNTAVAPTEIQINTTTSKGNTGSTIERIEIDSTRIVLDDTLYTDRVSSRIGIGESSPTASVHLKAGTATAGTSPLKFTSGTLNTTPEAGAIEYDGTDFYITNDAGSRSAIGSGSGGCISWELIAVDTTAVADGGYLVNASSGNINVTLPASPSEGDTVGVCDVYDKATTNVITILRNALNIEGTAEDLVIDIDGGSCVLVYVDATRGWDVVLSN